MPLRSVTSSKWRLPEFRYNLQSPLKLQKNRSTCPSPSKSPAAIPDPVSSTRFAAERSSVSVFVNWMPVAAGELSVNPGGPLLTVFSGRETLCAQAAAQVKSSRTVRSILKNVRRITDPQQFSSLAFCNLANSEPLAIAGNPVWFGSCDTE
jgi:hypothetical protein